MFASFRPAYVSPGYEASVLGVFGTGHAEFLNEVLVHRLCSAKSYLNGFAQSCLRPRFPSRLSRRVDRLAERVVRAWKQQTERSIATNCSKCDEERKVRIVQRHTGHAREL